MDVILIVVLIAALVFIAIRHQRHTVNDEDTIQRVEECHCVLDDLHNLLCDVVLEETGKGVADLSEHVRFGMMIYEVQAVYAAAKDYEIPEKYRDEFAIARFMKGNMPRNMANDIVQGYKQSSGQMRYWVKQDINGAAVYDLIKQDKKKAEEHIIQTLVNLTKQESLAEQLAM